MDIGYTILADRDFTYDQYDRMAMAEVKTLLLPEERSNLGRWILTGVKNYLLSQFMLSM